MNTNKQDYFRHEPSYVYIRIYIYIYIYIYIEGRGLRFPGCPGSASPQQKPISNTAPVEVFPEQQELMARNGLPVKQWEI